MKTYFILSAVGRDRPGIVAAESFKKICKDDIIPKKSVKSDILQ